MTATAGQKVVCSRVRSDFDRSPFKLATRFDHLRAHRASSIRSEKSRPNLAIAPKHGPNIRAGDALRFSRHRLGASRNTVENVVATRAAEPPRGFWYVHDDYAAQCVRSPDHSGGSNQRTLPCSSVASCCTSFGGAFAQSTRAVTSRSPGRSNVPGFRVSPG